MFLGAGGGGVLRVGLTGYHGQWGAGWVLLREEGDRLYVDCHHMLATCRHIDRHAEEHRFRTYLCFLSIDFVLTVVWTLYPVGLPDPDHERDPVKVLTWQPLSAFPAPDQLSSSSSHLCLHVAFPNGPQMFVKRNAPETGGCRLLTVASFWGDVRPASR